ncbi:MAG: helix-turn-helix transcriptional regulator [Bacilli bacterium]|nr:helix-turn-helix transcriptional regulator [Bacilli bacterium]
MDLGTRIKNIRYNNDISQDDLAKILKINRNNLSRIETNKSLPTSEVLIRLAEEFNVSIDSLLGVDLSSEKSEEIKASKIKKVSQYCEYLSNNELDFVINMLYVMTNHSKL